MSDDLPVNPDRRKYLRAGAIGASFLAALGLAPTVASSLARAAPGDAIGGPDVDSPRLAGVRVVTEWDASKHQGTPSDPWTLLGPQNAIADIMAKTPLPGGSLYFPYGQWSFPSALSVPGWISIIGCGPTATRISLASGANSRMIEYALATDTGQLLRLEHLMLDGNRFGQTSGLSAVCTWTQATGTYQAKDMTINDLWIDSYRGDGIYVVATHDWEVHHVAVERCLGAGIRSHASGPTGNIIGNYLFANVNGITIESGTNSLLVSDNGCVNNGQCGILVGSSSLGYATISGNDIRGSSYGAQGSYDGLQINNGHHIAVYGNHINGSNQRYAIGMFGSNSNHNRVFGNDLTQFYKASVYCGVPSPFSVFRDNDGFNPVGQVATPFDNTSYLITPFGSSASPLPSVDYQLAIVDAFLNVSSDAGVTVKSQSGTVLFSGPSYTGLLPVQHKLNFGAFTTFGAVVGGN